MLAVNEHPCMHQNKFYAASDVYSLVYSFIFAFGLDTPARCV